MTIAKIGRMASTQSVTTSRAVTIKAFAHSLDLLQQSYGFRLTSDTGELLILNAEGQREASIQDGALYIERKNLHLPAGKSDTHSAHH